uniref:G-protein coupled receptors family 1 profile domain-containing protein n=1 Tax=Oryzias melastigma TaxID=30732 RepID=A0A3B3CQN4_ORYME
MTGLNSSSADGLLGNASSSGLANVEQILVPVLNSLIVVLGTAGHSVVIVILCGRQRSAADLLLLSTIPFHTVGIALQRWPFGNVMCLLVGFLGSACSSASVFTLAMLAVSRYLTVVHPARAYSLLTPRRVSAAAVLLWVPACCLGVPQLVFRSVGNPRKTPVGLACFAFLSHRDQLIYGLFHFVMAFLLPLFTIAVAYSSIYVFLYRSQHAGRAPQVERYQRKVTKTTAMLVLAFTLCWLPSYGLTLALLAEKNSGATGTTPRYGPFTVFASLMATSSTVMNPILYVLMSQKFRQDLSGVKGLIGHCRGKVYFFLTRNLNIFPDYSWFKDRNISDIKVMNT